MFPTSSMFQMQTQPDQVGIGHKRKCNFQDMKRLFLPLLMISVALSSCRSVRTNSNEDKKSSDSLAAEISASSDLKVTKESLDTILTVKPDTLKGSAQIAPPDENKPDKPQVHELESNDIAVKATYNPRTGKLDIEARTKPKKIPVKINREITEAKHRSDAKMVARSEQSHSRQSQTAKEPPKLPWYLNLRNWFWILFILAVIYVCIRNRIQLFSLIRRVFSRFCS